MNPLDGLDLRYTTVLCDIWGVVHDGAQLLPGVMERLSRFRDDGRLVVLITNAPRPADTIVQDLDRIGLSRTLYHAVTSSGAAGIAALTSPPRNVGFLGTSEDRAYLELNGVRIVERGFGEVACTGLDESRGDPLQYVDQLRDWAAANLLMHCLNPDRIVIHCGQREACAGALADLYEGMGRRVAWYGKPYPTIYDHALALAGHPSKGNVLAIGDSLQTDMLGAARYGIDAVFVSNGIHAGEPVPPDFAGRNGLGDWRPLMTVAGLA